jgi:hypothetical protein
MRPKAGLGEIMSFIDHMMYKSMWSLILLCLWRFIVTVYSKRRLRHHSHALPSDTIVDQVA